MARDKTTVRIVSENRKARHRYHVTDALECGVLLVGTEVKSLRNGHASSHAEERSTTSRPWRRLFPSSETL